MNYTNDQELHEIFSDETVCQYVVLNNTVFYAIPGRVGYFISRDGRVFSQRRNRELVQHDNGKGYLQVSINGRLQYVHRLMWETFRGLIPANKDINHINHNRSDNRLDNLELISHRENCNKQRRHEILHELPDGAIELDDIEYRSRNNTYRFHDLHYYNNCVFERFTNDYRVIRSCSNGSVAINGIRVQLRKLLRLIEEQLRE